MKKRMIIIGIVFGILAAIPFVPFNYAIYDDGGTRSYTALAYTIVKWNREIGVVDPESGEGWVETYKTTSVYWYPDNFKPLGELWKAEQQKNG